MKYILTFFIFSLLSLFQKDTKQIEVITYWNKGDTQKIVIKEGFITYEGEEVVKKEVTSSYAEITVLEQTDSSYIVEWNYTEIEVDRLNVEVEEDPIDQRLEEMFNGMKLRYQTDEFGVFESTLNLDELLQTVNDSMEMLVKNGEMGIEEGEDAEMFVGLMKEIIFSEEMKSEFIRDIENYHFYHGNSFIADTVIHYEDAVENQVRGEDIPVKGLVSIRVNKEEKSISIEDIRTFDEEKVKQAIGDGTKKVKMSKRKKLMKEVKENRIDLKDVKSHTYDYEFGWLKYYEKSRTFTGDNQRKIEFVTIEEIQ
ncbi:MAG: hypothetical protein R3E32_23275 [Chitinophagales bacterium]